MNDLGTAALEDGARIDFAKLRGERLARTLAEMEIAGLDALVLGREANARYVSGARRLWTVGTRPFGPSCVLVREGSGASASAHVHLLSTWDDGIPDEIPNENLIQLYWNPRNLIDAVARIPGLGSARRIGVDGMSPLFDSLLSAALPGREWANAQPALLRARSRKTREEIACLRTATALAEGALAAVAPQIDANADPSLLTGRFHEYAARLGAPIPAFGARFERHGSDVHAHVGVLYAGYEGAVGQTFPKGPTRPRLEALLRELRTACRPGTTVGEIRAVHSKSSESSTSQPIVHGVGLGFEPPVSDHETIEPGMVVALHAHAADGFARDTLLVTADGTERLSRFSP